MNIEKAQDADRGTLVELRLAYLREDNGSLADDAAAAIRAGLPGYFARHLNKDLFCYLLREGNAVASCAFLLVVEKPCGPAFINGLTGIVLNVYTRPALRRRGYAGTVLDELLADARRMGLCTVELKSTEAGYALYRAAGFDDDSSKYRAMKWRNRADGFGA